MCLSVIIIIIIIVIIKVIYKECDSQNSVTFSPKVLQVNKSGTFWGCIHPSSQYPHFSSDSRQSIGVHFPINAFQLLLRDHGRIPRPDGIYNHSSKFWVKPGVFPLLPRKPLNGYLTLRYPSAIQTNSAGSLKHRAEPKLGYLTVSSSSYSKETKKNCMLLLSHLFGHSTD